MEAAMATSTAPVMAAESASPAQAQQQRASSLLISLTNHVNPHANKEQIELERSSLR
jgi:hypothetical protein